MQDNDPTSCDGHINSSCNPLGRLGPQFPQLSLKVLHMGFSKVLQPDMFNRFHEADKPRLQAGRQGFDFGTRSRKRFNSPSHSRYIANKQCQRNIFLFGAHVAILVDMKGDLSGMIAEHVPFALHGGTAESG